MITDTCLVLGLLAGALGIFLAVSARTYAARAVAECAELIQGSAGSRGTVDLRALRDLAVVRYDALREMSGQLSFSVALLNAAGDGVVLSSINGRSETRTYAKIVLGGSGTQELSPEEEQAVRSARACPARKRPRRSRYRDDRLRPGLPGRGTARRLGILGLYSARSVDMLYSRIGAHSCVPAAAD